MEWLWLIVGAVVTTAVLAYLGFVAWLFASAAFKRLRDFRR